MDSQPEFCLPEVLKCIFPLTLYLRMVCHPVVVQMPNWFLYMLTKERTTGSVHHRRHPDLQLPLYDGPALHHRTHWLHWYRLCDRAHTADWQVRRLSTLNLCVLKMNFKLTERIIMLCFCQIVNGGASQLHGASSQTPVCHLLEK